MQNDSCLNKLNNLDLPNALASGYKEDSIPILVGTTIGFT